jgi:histidine triad (HIT) family protein
VGAAGTTIGINDGRVTGQTVPHVHVHLVPRWADDGAGSVHLMFKPSPRLAVKDAAAKIRAALG